MYAIPVSGGMVSLLFGHCGHFALLDVDERTKKVLKKELVPLLGHQTGLAPQWLLASIWHWSR